jgi:hypothetical protein
MLAFEELILHYYIVYRPNSLDLKLSILAHGENLLALRSVTILVECSDQRNVYKVIGTIMKLMPLLCKKRIVRIIRAEQKQS